MFVYYIKLSLPENNRQDADNQKKLIDKMADYALNNLRSDRNILLNKESGFFEFLCFSTKSIRAHISAVIYDISQKYAIKPISSVKQLSRDDLADYNIENEEDKEFLDKYSEFIREKRTHVNQFGLPSDESSEKSDIFKKDPYDEIEKLIGAQELKKWALEMKNIKERFNGKPIFDKAIRGMSYLVTVNQGAGQTLCITLIASVIKDMLGCQKINYIDYVCTTSAAGRSNANEILLSDLKTVKKGNDKLTVFVIHIDAIQEHTSGGDWIKLMEAARIANKSAILIFTLNNVENDILYQLHRKIDNYICNRIIRISPPTNSNYIEMFEKRLGAQGVSVSLEAYDILIRKLAEEKADGSFFGYDTVTKVCDELLYNKVKNYALGKSDSPNCITKADVEELLFSDILKDGQPTGFEQLDSLISLQNIKKTVREIVASIKLQRSINSPYHPSMHMMFFGAPGTGKTIVARILGRIFREENLLSIGDFYEVSSKDLIGEYVGQTSPKTAEACRAAYGSVLFIDEAYTLADSSTNGYGKDAIGTLICEMENNRDNLVVIFAGYEKDLEQLFSLNPGLRDRIPYKLEFGNYNRDELRDIFYMAIPECFSYTDEFKETADIFFAQLGKETLEDENFSNGRFVRNLIERIISKAALRLQDENNDEKNILLVKTDFDMAVRDISSQQLNKKTAVRRLGFYE